jgi:hypothetical protein
MVCLLFSLTLPMAVSAFAITWYPWSVYFFRSPCQRQCELTPSLGIHGLFTSFAHLDKGSVSFCHHLVSMVCLIFTFESSPLKPLGQMNRNLVGSTEDSLLRLLILSGSVNKHGNHREFLCLVDQFLKFFSS